MQGGSHVDYPVRNQRIASAAQTPLPGAPQGGAVQTGKYVTWQ